jgi:hypothetical protein
MDSEVSESNDMVTIMTIQADNPCKWSIGRQCKFVVARAPQMTLPKLSQQPVQQNV